MNLKSAVFKIYVRPYFYWMMNTPNCWPLRMENLELEIERKYCLFLSEIDLLIRRTPTKDEESFRDTHKPKEKE